MIKARAQRFPGDTYGELTSIGVDTLIDIFKEFFKNTDGVFYDLGSGKGNLCFQIAENTDISKVIGVELHEKRYLESLDLLKKYKGDKLSYLKKDFTSMDFSDATIIFCSNEAMPRIVTEKILDNAPKGCLIILGRKPNLEWLNKNPNVKFKYSKIIDKTYSKNRGNWYIVKE